VISTNNIIKPDIFVEIDSGFVNQLRVMLAGSYLVQANLITSFTQKWVLSNQNNVNFLTYFEPLPCVKYVLEKEKPTEQHTIINEPINFTTLVSQYFPKSDSFTNMSTHISRALKYLQPLCDIENRAKDYIKKNEINKSFGIHVRRTCKTAFLEIVENRSPQITNDNFLSYTKNQTNIFLATDNNETQQWFYENIESKKLKKVSDIYTGEELFPGVFDTTKIQRHTTGLHTVLDLLVLKACKTFLGSNESSFSLLVYNWRKNSNDFHIFGNL
jgi:hypothetical protein